MSLHDWGWSDERRAEAAAAGLAALRACRVIGGGRGLYALADGDSTRYAPVSGSFGYKAVLPSDYPVAGDFVACREEGDSLVIEALLPRRGVVSRRAAGEREEEQLLAANADVAFLVFALGEGRGFLPRLVERFMALCREVEPVVVLNKADLLGVVDFSEEAFLKGVRAANGAVPVFKVSAKTGEGFPALVDWILSRR